MNSSGSMIPFQKPTSSVGKLLKGNLLGGEWRGKSGTPRNDSKSQAEETIARSASLIKNKDCKNFARVAKKQYPRTVRVLGSKDMLAADVKYDEEIR